MVYEEDMVAEENKARAIVGLPLLPPMLNLLKLARKHRLSIHHNGSWSTLPQEHTWIQCQWTPDYHYRMDTATRIPDTVPERLALAAVLNV